MRLSREELRARFRELRDLVNQWDPIGVFEEPDWPRDEYECVVGPLLRQVESRAPVEEIAQSLHAEFTGHFGLDIPLDTCRRWAIESAAWYSLRWPHTGPLPTPSK